MAIARYKDLCLDAADPAGLGAFWAAALDLTWQPKDGDGLLTGPTVRHTIWVNRVPEPKAAKNRIHLDVYARSVADLEALGARVLEPQHGACGWTVMADPEGGEFCAFLRDEPRAERLHALVVDCADPEAQANWWAAVFGVEASAMNNGWFSIGRVPDMPARSLDFVPVPEPKTVKNRLHWDVTVPAVTPLAEAGAVVLREPDDEIYWYVLADPEGNEFCAFTD